jgi:hypothetical protein
MLVLISLLRSETHTRKKYADNNTQHIRGCQKWIFSCYRHSNRKSMGNITLSLKLRTCGCHGTNEFTQVYWWVLLLVKYPALNNSHFLTHHQQNFTPQYVSRKHRQLLNTICLTNPLVIGFTINNKIDQHSHTNTTPMPQAYSRSTEMHLHH